MLEASDDFFWIVLQIFQKHNKDKHKEEKHNKDNHNNEDNLDKDNQKKDNYHCNKNHTKKFSKTKTKIFINITMTKF